MDIDEKQKKAEQTLHKLVQDIDEHPHDYRTYYDLSTFLIQLKSYTQAEELLVKALGLFANQSKKITNILTYGLGNVYYAAGEFTKAIAQFQQVTDKDLQADAYIMLAQSYMSQKNYKKALVFLLTAQERAKQEVTINLLIGQCLISLGEFVQATDYYDLILANDPQNGEANFNRGLIAMVLGENFKPYFKAAEKYDKQYFDQEQAKISDIEKFIQIRKKKQTK